MSLPPPGFVKPSHPAKKKKEEASKLGTISEDKRKYFMIVLLSQGASVTLHFAIALSLTMLKICCDF